MQGIKNEIGYMRCERLTEGISLKNGSKFDKYFPLQMVITTLKVN